MFKINFTFLQKRVTFKGPIKGFSNIKSCFSIRYEYNRQGELEFRKAWVSVSTLISQLGVQEVKSNEKGLEITLKTIQWYVNERHYHNSIDPLVEYYILGLIVLLEAQHINCSEQSFFSEL